MAWWAWLLLAISLLLLLTALVPALPLRIFVRYLRENKKDRISLRIRLGLFGLRLELWKKNAADEDFTWRLDAGRIKLPAALLKRSAGLMGLPDFRSKPGDPRWKEIAGFSRFAKAFVGRRQARLLLKKVTWSRFDLDLSWGWDDPALTGMATGGAWALGGILTGLLHEYFTVAARPQIRVLPLFRPSELQVRWEGEAALSLYRFFRLRSVVKKIGGAGSGTSSHRKSHENRHGKLKRDG